MKEVIINGVKYVEAAPDLSNVVLVRTYSAGVHFGELVSRGGKEITLKNARRLFSWQGACSLSQVAVDGVDYDNSKISVAVPSILLTEAIEIIPMPEATAKAMLGAPEWKK